MSSRRSVLPQRRSPPRGTRAALGPADPPVLLPGAGTAVRPVLTEAVRGGLDTRIGLEDTRHLPDGGLVADNAALVVAALAVDAR